MHEDGEYPVLCWQCIGTGCQNCKKNGKIYLTEKPINLLTNAGKLYFKCYTVLKNYNKWPVEKSYLQQPIKFINVIEYCDRVAAQLSDSKKLETEVNSELEQKQSKQGRLSGNS